MRKLLGKSAPDTPSADLSVTSAPASSIIAYRPLKSQNAVHAVGAPVATFDVSRDRRAVVFGGPHVLKTAVLDDPNSFDFRFNQGLDVRAAIVQRSSGIKSSVAADMLNIRDVKWQGHSSIYTACANGRIFAYDVARIGAGASQPLEYIQIQEDSRQVNSLDVNPHSGNWLLSGSQDGLARVFETGAPVQSRAGLTFRQRWNSMRCIDSVRQVKWSPRMGTEIACCTDSGVVTKWDVRHPTRPVLRISAHERACTGISWHPDGVHLMSAGADMKVHVWDLGSGADKRQKAKYTLLVPAPVLSIAWRPGLWSATAQSRRVAQVAISYEDSGPRRYGTPAVHVWDLARPTNPYKEIERFESSPSAMIWQDQDRLWTAGSDGIFNQCDVAYAPKAIDRQPTTVMAFSPKGEVLMFLEEKEKHPKARLSIPTATEPTPRSSYGDSPHTPMLSVSKSDSEDDVLNRFLNIETNGSTKRRHHKRRLSGRSQHLNSAPPSNPGSDSMNKVLTLDQGIKLSGMFKNTQAMSFGPLHAAKTVSVYQFMSSSYLEILEKELPCATDEKTLPQRVTTILDQYARVAEQARQFRLAQTWRILAFGIALMLTRRAQYHLEVRVNHFQKLKIERPRDRSRSRKGDMTGDQTPRRPSTQAGATSGNHDSRFLGPRSLLSEEIDSTSNVATPRARPADQEEGIDHQDHVYHHGKYLTPIAEPESFTIGPSAHASLSNHTRHRLDSEPISLISHESGDTHKSSTEGYDFYDTEALANAIDMPDPKDGQSWAHGTKGEPSQQERMRGARQGSTDSYGQMFSISDGSKPSTIQSSFSTSNFARPNMAARESNVTDGSGESHKQINEEETETSSKAELDRKGSQDSVEDIFPISQTTVTSEGDDTYPSQDGFPSQFSSGQLPEASKPTLTAASVSSYPTSPTKPISFQHHPSPTIIESDYLPWPEDPPYPYPLISSPKTPLAPLDPYKLISRALEFECRISALNSSAMILLLRPLVPDSVIDNYQATAVLRQHHSRLMKMGLFVEAALLRNLCIKGWPTGLPEWGDNYTPIFAPAQDNIKVGLACSSCRKPREIDPKDPVATVWTCERCKANMAPCAVCGHREAETASYSPSELDVESLPEWWYCPGCAHGGHASCLAIWHAPSQPPSSEKFSGGCCPLDGCGHACLPGKYRVEALTSRSEAVAAQSTRSALNSGYSTPRGVRSDTHEVPQSRAVGMAREMVGNGNNGAGPSGGGILSSSPRDRERRKSVKFATQDR